MECCLATFCVTFALYLPMFEIFSTCLNALYGLISFSLRGPGGGVNQRLYQQFLRLLHLTASCCPFNACLIFCVEGWLAQPATIGTGPVPVCFCHKRCWLFFSLSFNFCTCTHCVPHHCTRAGSFDDCNAALICVASNFFLFIFEACATPLMSPSRLFSK